MNNSPSMLRRLGAILYDCLLCLACLLVFVGVIVTLNKGQAVSSNQQFFLTICLISIIYFYFVGFWRQGGQTPGMKVWKIILVADAPPASMGKLSLRFGVGLLTFGLCFAFALSNRERICLHDKLSKTSLRVISQK